MSLWLWGICHSSGTCRAGRAGLVLGSGPIGLVTIEALSARGVTRIIAVDIFDFRLKKAKELGANFTINAKEEDVKAQVEELTQGRGVDVVFETAGSVSTSQLTVEVTKKGGRVVLIGLPSQTHLILSF